MQQSRAKTRLVVRFAVLLIAIMVATFEEPGGIKWVDEDLGICRFSVTHPDIEMFYGSNHYNLGVQCADCHMPVMRTNMGGGYTKEDYETGEHANNYRIDSGTTFTTHDASGSPLDSFAAMNYCLTCHKSQGVESVEGMVALVRETQEKFAKRYDEVKGEETACLQILKDAISNKSASKEVLDKARADYALANAYLMWANGAPEKPGEKVAHNPEGSFEYCDRASAIYEDIVKSLS